jgi:peptidyl-tRNA hydrolase
MRRDLNMTPGKLAVQVGHGVDFVHVKKTSCYREWTEVSRRRKIVVAVADAHELAEVKALLIERSTPYHEIWDAGLTEFKSPTHTGIVIPPWPQELLPGKIKFLPLWK